MAAKHVSWFTRFAKRTTHITGLPATFSVAVASVAVWAATGPIYHYSETWQMVINTGTTIITFLMVFLIQNAQNRDTAALQIKLDELIRAIAPANNAMLDLEELDDPDLQEARANYLRLASVARGAAKKKTPAKPGATKKGKDQ